MKPCQHKLAVYYERLEVCPNSQSMFRLTKTMDHSPIRKTFELGKFISTAGKSIHISKCGNAFPRVIQKYTKFANFT